MVRGAAIRFFHFFSSRNDILKESYWKARRMTDHDLEIAKELKRRCGERVPLVDMRAFGSRARGDNLTDSDLDIFIEVEHLNRSVRRLIQDIAWEIGLDHSVIITPIVFSRDEIERSPIRSSPIVQAVREEGITI
jgi:uncharacterized protein